MELWAILPSYVPKPKYCGDLFPMPGKALENPLMDVSISIQNLKRYDSVHKGKGKRKGEGGGGRGMRGQGKESKQNVWPDGFAYMTWYMQ